tara:strand:- start:848 stop:1810 length:963 start_codon:yes stop_codon:yes gene_type:complete
MNLVRYVSAFIIVTAIGVLYDRYKNKWGFLDIESQNRENIKKYLLNENSILNGKPILWIHNIHELNSRQWTSFASRHNKNVNQPYRNLCIDTLIKHCGDDFNVCLIDDESFAKLIPGWNLVIDEIPNPIKTHIRYLAFTKLLFYYGGMMVPSTTVALKSFKSCYDKLLSKKDAFVGEFVDKSIVSNTLKYFPNASFLGCKKNSSAMREIMLYLEKLNDNSDEYKFNGTLNKFIFKLCEDGKISLLNGKYIGTKINNNEVLIDDLLSNKFLKISNEMICLVIPEDQLMKRSKYQWFLRSSKNQIMESDLFISKIFMISLGK